MFGIYDFVFLFVFLTIFIMVWLGTKNKIKIKIKLKNTNFGLQTISYYVHLHPDSSIHFFPPSSLRESDFNFS